MSSSCFWQDRDSAQRIVAEVGILKGWIRPLAEIEQRLASLRDLLAEAIAWADQGFLDELEQEKVAIEQLVEQLELRAMLSGEFDGHNCYLSVNAGAGGTEACDWAAMLLRMYQRWCSRKGWQVEVLDVLAAEVAGVKSGLLRVVGPLAYGYCKAERGVHRLVRLSPFDSNARRHTSFASVAVTPEIAEDICIDVQADDLRIETFRASGAGGQHVNKTDSAVRMTHLATGIVVTCQRERSQLQNREICMKLLRAKLYEKEAREREEALQRVSGEKKEIGWGSQIRSYVFHPYTLVKDLRTKVESGNLQAVMDGGLDLFVDAYLKSCLGKKERG